MISAWLSPTCGRELVAFSILTITGWYVGFGTSASQRPVVALRGSGVGEGVGDGVGVGVGVGVGEGVAVASGMAVGTGAAASCAAQPARQTNSAASTKTKISFRCNRIPPV